MNPPRVLAIGDIHGCLRALDALLDSLDLHDDELVFLGDYVDRGPDSRGVLERLLELSARPGTTFLRGNHDLWMERARDDVRWFKEWLDRGVGGRATLDSYGGLENVPGSHWQFLDESLVEFHQTEREIFVHGGVDPELELFDQPQQVLLWERIHAQTPHFSGKRIICGHTSQKNGLPLDKGFAVCVDTFCCGGGWLSALDVRTNRIWQANEQGETRALTL